MSDRLNSKEGLFEPGQIVSYNHYAGISNTPEKVKLLLLNKTQEKTEVCTNDIPAVWRAYYLSGSTGNYINSVTGATSKGDKNLVLVFEYALEL